MQTSSYRIVYRISMAIGLVVFFIRCLREPGVLLFVVAIVIFAFGLGSSFGDVRARYPDKRKQNIL